MFPRFRLTQPETLNLTLNSNLLKKALNPTPSSFEAQRQALTLRGPRLPPLLQSLLPDSLT